MSNGCNRRYKIIPIAHQYTPRCIDRASSMLEPATPRFAPKSEGLPKSAELGEISVLDEIHPPCHGQTHIGTHYGLMYAPGGLPMAPPSLASSGPGLAESHLPPIIGYFAKTHFVQVDTFFLSRHKSKFGPRHRILMRFFAYMLRKMTSPCPQNFRIFLQGNNLL